MKPEHLIASLSALELTHEMGKTRKKRERTKILSTLSGEDRRLLLQAEYLKQSSQAPQARKA